MQVRGPRSVLGDLGRTARVAFAIALMLELTYVLAATVILKTGLLEHWLNSDPEALFVRYESAFSIVPGRVTVRNFKLRNQDSKIQFLLEVSDATLDIDLLALAKRHFLATHVEARGVRFRLRNRLQAFEGVPLRAREFPPIAGFPDPPLARLNVPQRLLGSRPFTIELDRVSAELQELWIFEYHYLGLGHVSGSFRIIPAKRLRVGPADLWLSGTVRVGTKQVASRLLGRLTCTISDFDVRKNDGWKIFEQVSARGTLKATIDDVAFTHIYLAPTTKLRLSQGGGELDARLILDRGEFGPGSRLRYHTDRAELTLPTWLATADATVLLTVTADAARRLGTLEVASKRISFAENAPHSTIPSAVVKEPVVALSTTVVKLSEPWPMAGARFELPELRVPDLRLVNALGNNGSALRFDAGSATSTARATIDASGALLGRASARMTGASATLAKKTRVYASVEASATLKQPRANVVRGQLTDVVIKASPTHIQTPDGRTGVGSIRCEAGTISYRDGAMHGMHATLHAHFPDARPVLQTLGVDLGTLPKLAASLLDTSNLRATAEISKQDNRLDVHLRDARTGGLWSRGRWRKEGNHTRGAFILDLPLTTLGIETGTSGTEIAPFVGKDWLNQELGRLGLGASGS